MFVQNGGGRMPSSTQLEIEQLREDNRRLLNMIKETKDFKEFAGIVEDSGGNVRFATKASNQNDAIKIEEDRLD